MRNCRDWERGGTHCLPHSRSAADSVLNVLGSAANKPIKRPCVHGNNRDIAAVKYCLWGQEERILRRIWSGFSQELACYLK